MNDPHFLEYLQQELGISETEIALANREQQPSVTELPIVLWNYGLIDLEKLGKIFDWIEKPIFFISAQKTALKNC